MTRVGETPGEARGREHGHGVPARRVGDDGGADGILPGPVEEGMDAGDGRYAGGEGVAEHRLLAVEDGGVLAGEVAAEDVHVRVAHDVGAVLGEGEVAAALGQDLDEGGVVQVVGVDQRAVEIEEERGSGHARARRGRAARVPV